MANFFMDNYYVKMFDSMAKLQSNVMEFEEFRIEAILYKYLILMNTIKGFSDTFKIV